MKGFLFGLGVGIGLGVLFAPMSGDETRSRLSDTANDLADSARDSIEQGRDRVQRGVSSIRETAQSAVSGQSRTGSQTRPTGTESNV